jgi:RNA polymerase sigma factor (sigma-70 family)
VQQDEADAEAIAASIADPARFEPVFRRHYQAIRAYLQRRVGRDLGEELAAQTFVKAFERRTSYDSTYASAKPWLFAIATNLLRHHVRDELRHLRTLQGQPASVLTMDDEDDRLTALHLRPMLASALADLADADREALLLFVHGGLSYDEIATVLGVPIGTVRSRIYRAKERLRERLPSLRDIRIDSDEGFNDG